MSQETPNFARAIKGLDLLSVALSCWLGAQVLAAEELGIRDDLRNPNARVVIVQHHRGTITFNPQPTNIREMVRRGILELTAKPNVAAAWRSLISTQEMVGIKVHSAPGALAGTRPGVVGAVIESLLEAGMPSSRIIVWDKKLSDLRLAGYSRLSNRYGIQLAGSADAGYDEAFFYETPLLGKLVFGDLEFGQMDEGVGRKSFVSKLLTQQITKIIQITPLLNHNATGVSGNLLSLALSSVDNTLRFETDAHRYATAVPEIYALPWLGDRVVLNIVDALIAQYTGEQRSLLHYSAVLNELRFSTDPLALDVLSIRELSLQRALANAPPVKVDLELYQNASLLEIGQSDPSQIQIVKVKLQNRDVD